MSLPCVSLHLMISKVARMVTIADQTDASAKCLPGQIRRPAPNAYSILSSLSSPAASKKRSGQNSSGLAYLASLRVMALDKLRLIAANDRGLFTKHSR